MEILYHSPIDMDEEYIGKGGDIMAFSGGLIGIEESSSVDEPLYIIQAENNRFRLTRFGTKGQGPIDFLHPYPLQYISEDVFGVYDMFTKKYKEVVIPKQTYSVQVIKSVSFQNSPFRVVKTAYNQYLGLSGINGMFSLMDSTGIEIASFFEYPYRDNDERKLQNSVRAMAYQGVVTINPSGDKCVYAAIDGEIIHFYKIWEDSITVINKIEKAFPVYQPEGNNITSSWKSTVGYTSLSATNRYVYALYCGKKLEDMRGSSKSDINYDTKELRIFDWEGNLLKKYILDVPCRYISVSQNDKELWAITYAPEIQPVIFDLSVIDSCMQEQSVNNTTDIRSNSSLETSHYFVKTSDGTPHATNTVDIPVGKINIGEEKQLTMPFQIPIEYVTTTGEGIFAKDSLIASDRSTVFIRIIKQRPGIFKDTINIVSKSMNLSLVVSGEAVK